jgi:signal transduction histidine kinase
VSAVATPAFPRRARIVAVGVIAATLVLAVAGFVVLAEGAARQEATALAALTLIAGLSFVGSGLIAWRRRPEARTGPLMIAAGFFMFVESLAQSDEPLPFTVGNALGGVTIAVVAHLVLAFPEGRLHSRAERFLVAAIYFDAVVLQIVMMMFMGFEGEPSCPCPENLLLVGVNDSVHGVVMTLERTLGIALAGTIVAVILQRWRSASAPLRRAMGPLVAAGGATMLLLGALLVSAASGSRDVSNTISVLERIAFAAVPIAYVFGLVRARLARGAVSDLVVTLRDMPEPGRLRDVLADALGDPSLDVAYWRPESQSYVGVDGQRVEPTAGNGRAITALDQHGERVAVLVHDDALLEEPGLLDAVSAAAGMALENERLLADLRAQVEMLRESRARIVEAGDTERRRLERNLHDGAQQRLVSLSLGLGMAGGKVRDDPDGAIALIDGARRELTQALAELRELAEGIHPAILTDRGLRHALERLAERAPVPVDLDVELGDRLPEPIEAAAYYVVAEALTNVAKYARASRARVQIADAGGLLRVEIADDGVGGADPRAGSGLRGLDDRVQAFGGRIVVDSPPGQGTRIRAELPT